MIDVVPITPWDMFNMLFTGTPVAEFNGILCKASGKTFDFIQEIFNEKICIPRDENPDEFKA